MYLEPENTHNILIARRDLMMVNNREAPDAHRSAQCGHYQDKLGHQQ